MKLIQILLPLRDNSGRKFDRGLFAEVHDQLIERFGGLTAYTRSPARGLWQSAGATKRDDMIIVEVMVKAFHRRWWREYRRALEKKFRQDEIVVRAQDISRV